MRGTTKTDFVPFDEERKEPISSTIPPELTDYVSSAQWQVFSATTAETLASVRFEQRLGKAPGILLGVHFGLFRLSGGGSVALARRNWGGVRGPHPLLATTIDELNDSAVPRAIGQLFFGWRWRAVQVGQRIKVLADRGYLQVFP